MAIVGRSREILKSFGAPPDIAADFEKRAAALMGHGIRHEQLERLIVKSADQLGFTDWDSVAEKLGQAARDIYDGKRIKL